MCPEKLLFKYSYVNVDGTPKRNNGMSIICLLCKKRFSQLTLTFMTSHRGECKITNQPKPTENVAENTDVMVLSEDSQWLEMQI